jgi:predicted alpha/beta-fold hydrolase
MRDIRLPALALNAWNDPFVPAQSLPQKSDVSSSVTLWQPQQGGHVGFASGAWPGHVLGMPEAVGRWLMAAAGLAVSGQNTHKG